MNWQMGLICFLIGLILFQKKIIRKIDEWRYTKRCHQQFSRCLDCDLHNHCSRYHKHRLSAGLQTQQRFKERLKWLVRFFNRLDTPSFMPDMRVPLWKSILIDWGCLFSLGLWKPRCNSIRSKAE